MGNLIQSQSSKFIWFTYLEYIETYGWLHNSHFFSPNSHSTLFNLQQIYKQFIVDECFIIWYIFSLFYRPNGMKITWNLYESNTNMCDVDRIKCAMCGLRELCAAIQMAKPHPLTRHRIECKNDWGMRLKTSRSCKNSACTLYNSRTYILYISVD